MRARVLLMLTALDATCVAVPRPVFLPKLNRVRSLAVDGERKGAKRQARREAECGGRVRRGLLLLFRRECRECDIVSVETFDMIKPEE